MSTIDYTHDCRKGKLLISIDETDGNMCQCAPIKIKFVQVPDDDDMVREYCATYTYGQLYDICPVFAALDELYGTLARRPKVRVYDSHVTVNWTYRGINVGYKIKLDLMPTPDPRDIIDDSSDLMDRVMSAEAESAQLRIKLGIVTDQLKTALDVLSQMNGRLARLETRDIENHSGSA